MVTPHARGKGVARAMCEHSQVLAGDAGFEAMQFNAVVASNHVAVALWQRLGFAIVGTVPRRFAIRRWDWWTPTSCTNLSTSDS